MHAGQGVPETFMDWGDQLLRMYDKPRAAPNSSVSLQVRRAGMICTK